MASCFSDFAWIWIPIETCQVLANAPVQQLEISQAAAP
jgi:hypothetical protein